MKKHLLLFILIICSSAFLSSNGYGQEVTYNTSNQFYYNPFDNGSLGVLNNYIAGTTNKTVVTAATSAAAFNGTTALTSVAGVNAKNNIYGQFIPGSADQNLNNNDFEWTFLYKNNSSTSPIEPYDNGQKAGPVNSGEAAWQYWLTATGNDQTSATVQGFYMTQIGTNMILRYRNNQFDIQSLITFPITNNVVWTIKVQRLTTGRWRIWANPVSTNSEAITYVNQADQGAFNTYAYSMLATTDLRTTGNFYFDSFKLYTRKMTVTGINAASYGITQPSYYPNQSNIALFGMQISIRGTYSIYSINTGYTNSLGTNPNAFFSSAKVVKSIDDTYATTADNTTIATFTPDSQPFQSGAISGGDVNYSSGNTDGSLTRVADYFLVFSMLSSINYGNPAPYTSYVFTGPSQITTTDYQTPPSGGYTNNATSGNNTITFAAGPPPTISYTAPAAYTVGTAIATLTPTTTGSPTSYSTTGLPPGLSLNTSTGQITGTPTSSSPATSYTVTATNANGSASTTVSMTVNGPPVISYATPQTYTVGTAIPTLDDVSSGTAVGIFGYGTAASFGIAAGQVFGLATDASGNIYGADYTNGIIYKYTSTGTRTTFITIGQNITDIAIDGLGNFYFAGFNSNSVYKYNSSGVLQATITGFSNPYQIETDAANNVYVTNYGAGTLSRILAGATTSTTYATGLTGAAGITIDNAGNLYVSSYSAGTVVKIPAGSTTASAFASGFNGPRALTADNAGNIFVADGGNNAIKRITSAGVVSAFLSGFNVPGEIVFDPSGNAYISNSGNTGSNNIFKAVQPGGYFINKPLSAGLYFDVTNGQFTGTPTAVSAATTYTVTAYNAYGSGSTTVNITVNPAAPIISYTTPQTYSVGTAITPLPPTNTGGPVGGYAALSTFASVNNSNGLAIDASNNVYVTSTTGNALYKYNSAGTLLTTTTVTSPYGVAVDQQGNVYVASGANVLKYNSAGTLVTTITGFSAPLGITVDASNNIYVTDNGNGNIYKLSTASTTAGTAFLTGFTAPWAIAVNTNGDLYVSQYSQNNIIKVASGSTTKTTFVSTGLNSPRGIIFDGAGNLYVADLFNSSIKSINSAGVATTLVSGLNGPTGVVFDPSGNLLISDYNNNNIRKSVASGYAVTSGTLPAGLNLNAYNGVINGIPTTVTAATNVTITATNAGGSGSTVVNITVNPAAPIITYITPQNYSVGTAIPALSPTNTGGVITSTTVSPALPAGLSISATGVISGTPTVPSGATIYNITATNVTGSSTFALTITVNLPVAVSNYAFSQTITLNTSALGINSTLTNFPYLVYIKEDALKSGVNCANNVQFPTGGTNGYDFGFTTSGGTNELNYEIESFDPSTGTLLAWVQVPSITKVNSTLTFYFGSTAPNHPASFAKGTWGSDYLTVYHFNETPATGSTTADATTNGRTGTTGGMTSADLVSGQIGTSYSFNGSSKKITAAAAPITGPFTLSAWVNVIANGTDQKVMTNQVTANDGGYKLGIYNNNQFETESGGVGNRSTTSPAPPALSSGTWYYVQGVYTGTTMSNYVNGQISKTLTTSANPYGNNPFYVGVGEGGNQYYFNGRIDEARLSNVAKSSDWLLAEYNNQNTPSTYTISSAAITSTLATAAPLGASLVYTWTGGASSQDIAATGNWTAPTSGNPNIPPPIDGTASIVIPTGLSIYPKLLANASFFGVTLASGASINLNGFTMNVGCNIYNNNNTTNGILYNSNNASQITWNGITASQSYVGTNTTVPAQVGTMVVNNTTTGATINITGGRLDVYSLLTLTAGSINVNATGALTLKSTATQTAAVDKITNNTTTRIDGYVNVERFLTGGGLQLNRGYRLMSSPVNQTQATAAATNTFGLSYLKNHTYLNFAYLGAFIGGTGGTGNGFSGTSVGPTIYLYKESLPLSNTGYISGKHVGIAAITTVGTPTSTTTGTTATVNTVHATDPAVTNLSIPVGNGFLLFFVGPSTRVNGSSALAPADATITANGYLNQGPFTVNLWYTPTGGVGKLSNSAAALPGFNMIGNPYPSTINLQTVLTDNTASIDNIYVLNSRTGGVNQNYIAYTPNGASSPTAQGFAVSGGGFIVHAKSSAGTGATLSFNEAQKVPTTQPTGTGLIMSTPRQSIAVDELAGGAGKTISAIQPRPATQATTGFYVKMEKDTVVYDYCGIYFKSGYSTKFEDGDARFLAGPTTPVTMSSLTSDGVKSAVNMLPDYKVGTRIKLNITATASGLYKLRLEDIRNIDTLYDIYLVDKLKKDSLNIRRYGVYNFNVLTTDTATFGANRFELAFQHKAVPAVVIVAFNGDKVTEGVKLNWKTYNESNYTGFTLEKKNATTNQFEPIYEKQSDGSGTYNFVDQAPASGNNLYRLKQNDIDGKISYSDEVKIFYDKLAGAGLFSVFPNPTVEMINVSISNIQATGTYKLMIFNAAGNLMVQKSSTSGNWTENVANLKPGTYIAEIIKSNGTSLGKAKFIKR